MLLQTNSYLVTPERRAAHARIVLRFRDVMARLGHRTFEVVEQVGDEWSADEGQVTRFVQLLGFASAAERDRLRAAEAADGDAQALIAEFCDVIDYEQQQAAGTFVTSYFTSSLGDGDALRVDDAAAEVAG